jgi:hypothetical protein
VVGLLIDLSGIRTLPFVASMALLLAGIAPAFRMQRIACWPIDAQVSPAQSVRRE